MSLTRTAQHIKSKTLPRLLPRIFDRPTSWIVPDRNPKSKKGGFYIVPATKRNLEATVQIKDGVTKEPGRGGRIGTPAFNILGPHIKGTKRHAKSHEKQLRRLGILREGEYTVPGEGIRLNKFGNLTGNTYAKILADVQAKSYSTPADSRYDITAGQATLKAGKKKYFYHPNLRPRGIYIRTGRRTLKVALYFIRQPQYVRRFDFAGISRRVVQTQWPKEFNQALAKALRTAR